MIISKAYAQRLIRTGRAVELDPVHDQNRMFWSLNRLDVQRVDHVESGMFCESWINIVPLTAKSTRGAA